MIKKVAVFSSTRGDMSILTPLLLRMKKEKGIQPLFFIGGTHLKKKYGINFCSYIGANITTKVSINTFFFNVLKHEIGLSIFLGRNYTGIIQQLSKISKLLINPYSLKMKSIFTLCSR